MLATSPLLIEPTRLSMHDDVFAQGAVTVDQVIERARSQPFVPHQIIVAVALPVSVSQANATAQNIDWKAWTESPDTRVIKSLMTIGRGQDQSVALIHLDLGPGRDPLAVVRKLGFNQQVLWSSPNFRHVGADPRSFTPNDPLFEQQYHHIRMQNHLAWDTTLGNPNIIMAITDDGFEIEHQDLWANVWQNSDEIPGNGIDDDGNGYIDDFNGWNFVSNNNDPGPSGSQDHGTHIAGIAAGVTNNALGISGTAGRIKFMPIKFFDGSSSWTAAIINQSYKYAVDNGAKIVTTSYDLSNWINDPVYLAGLQYVYDAGALHFISAGNSGILEPVVQKFEQSLVVASTGTNDTRSSFSNYGTGIDISAPGSTILSTVLNDSYGSKSGTSMAAANAAGTAALIWSANPTWNRDQVANRLMLLATQIETTFNSLPTMGGGRANAFRSITVNPGLPFVRFTTLPYDNSVTETWNVDSFSVVFRQLMNPATVNNSSNFELREAGGDKVFGTPDDRLVTINRVGIYSVGTNEVKFTIPEGKLGPGVYRLRLSGQGLRDPFNQPIDGDGNGIGGDDYFQTFTLNPKLNRVTDDGSFIHTQTFTSNIASAGQKRSFFLALDANQRFSVVIESLSTLVPTLSVRGPDGSLLANGSLLGNKVEARNIAATTTGNYKIEVGRVGSSVGEFRVKYWLNSDVELESLGGANNSSLATAQSLDASAVGMGTRNSSRMGVTGENPISYGAPAVTEGFESGSLSAAWTTSTSTTNGRVRVTSAQGAAVGNYALILDTTGENLNNLSQATWTINLQGQFRPVLKFREISFNDEVHPMTGAPFSSSFSDGVAFSVDGNAFYRLWTPTSNDPLNVWTERVIDLAVVASGLGIQLQDTIYIRFQQYDNFPLPQDGRGFDEISITQAVFQEDWYSFTLADGEKASIRGATKSAIGQTHIALYDSQGALLAAGSNPGFISQYQDITTNGVRDTYFVKVSSTAENYSLGVSRNAELESDAHDSIATAQSIQGIAGTFGYVDRVGFGDFYKFEANAGDWISFTAFFPGAGPNLIVNTLAYGEIPGAFPNIESHYLLMDLYNPSGSPVSSGGTNLGFEATVTGTWRLRLYTNIAYGGDYYLQRNNIIASKMEVGTIPLVGPDPVNVTFNQSFIDPIVIVSPPKNVNSSVPLIVNPVSITSTGFRLFISNWNGNSEDNVSEEVSYFVVERGINYLASGTVFVAGSLTLEDGQFFRNDFEYYFAAPPVVVGTVAGNPLAPSRSPLPTPRAIRFRNISQTGFEVRTQFNEAGNGRGDELVDLNYVAIQRFGGTYTHRDFQMFAGHVNATHQLVTSPFPQHFGATPKLFASIQTFNDPEPAIVRLNSVSTENYSLYLQEEKSFDPEMDHGEELVGVIALRPYSFQPRPGRPESKSWLWPVATSNGDDEDSFRKERKLSPEKVKLKKIDEAFQMLRQSDEELLEPRMIVFANRFETPDEPMPKIRDNEIGDGHSIEERVFFRGIKENSVNGSFVKSQRDSR